MRLESKSLTAPQIIRFVRAVIVFRIINASKCGSNFSDLFYACSRGRKSFGYLSRPAGHTNRYQSPMFSCVCVPANLCDDTPFSSAIDRLCLCPRRRICGTRQSPGMDIRSFAGNVPARRTVSSQLNSILLKARSFHCSFLAELGFGKTCLGRYRLVLELVVSASALFRISDRQLNYQTAFLSMRSPFPILSKCSVLTCIVKESESKSIALAMAPKT